MTVTELIGSSLLRVAYSESRGNSELAVRMAMHARERERSGNYRNSLAENHGLVFFFLLLPKVLVLPSVTLAKNCEHAPM